MASYRAPLREIRFWLSLFDDGAAAQGSELQVSADIVDAVLEEAARFAEAVLDPLYRLADVRGATCVDGHVVVPEEVKSAYRQFAEAGWVGLPIAPEFGGQGLPQRVATAVNEIWKSANLAFSLCPMLTQGAVEALCMHASESLRRRFVPKMAAGDWTGTMNLTEPQAGSDLAALRTIATPEGDRYRIKGRKIFITWGDHDLAENVIHLVLARTPDAAPGVHGISMFVVPKFLVMADGSLGEPNEVSTVALEQKLGIHGSPTCALNYGEAQGAIGYLVGEEGSGLKYMFTMMNSARLAVGVEGLALCERAYQLSLAYAQERLQGGTETSRSPVAIIEHADVRRMLLLMKAATDAMRGLSYRAAAEIDRAKQANGVQAHAANARVSLLTPIVKGWCTEVAQEVVSLGLQIHGGVGYIEETGVAQIFRDARITTIYEGTTGIQANDLVGRKIIRDEGAALEQLLAEVDQTANDLASFGDRLQVSAKALADGAATARAVVQHVLRMHRTDTESAGAVAVSALMLLGTLFGGWVLACGAAAALRDDGSASGEESWVEAKGKTSDFYAQHFMPRIDAYASTIMAGSELIENFSITNFER